MCSVMQLWQYWKNPDNKLDNNYNDVTVNNFDNVIVGKSVENSTDKKYTRKRNAQILP